MGGVRLPNRVMIGGLEGPEQRGSEVKENKMTDCVAKDVRIFCIDGDWTAAALKQGTWDDTVIEGGRRFMVGWRKEEKSMAKIRQSKKGG